MVKYKHLPTIFTAVAASLQAVIAADVSKFDKRQDSLNDDSPDTGDLPGFSEPLAPHQVYEWYNRTGLAGFGMARLGPNATAKERLETLGPYKPGRFQAALQSCLDDFVDESQYCITRYGHSTDPNPDEEVSSAPQGSTAILCCKEGYTAYLFNYRDRNAENPDVRINCYHAALIANETLSSLLNQDTMAPVFQGSVEPIVQIGDNSSSTYMARSYWSEDKSWGIDIYYLEGGGSSNSTNDTSDACPIETPYTWVTRGKWADLDKPVEENLEDPPEETSDPSPTMDLMDPEETATDMMNPEETTAAEGSTSTMGLNGTAPTANATMRSTLITGEVTIQTAIPEATSAMSIVSTTPQRTATTVRNATPVPTDDSLGDGSF
ncbi:hypothetical protein TWF106_010748 [Orbilia oligospora]|uniref:Lysine-specific metallo-endopeptidase domain-containing protein n=1 Tax=Orbilia oligospora TaxID=2813651 RepID=A0A7C8UGS2_ORBOL|nr:hypothetical protein TWF106_010748 [Orbilia oligospora]